MSCIYKYNILIITKQVGPISGANKSALSKSDTSGTNVPKDLGAPGSSPVKSQLET